MDNNNTCNLRSIILDYAEFQMVKLDNMDKERSYIKDRTREIKALCKCINLDLQQFYLRGKNEYKIPSDVATVISVYLRQPSQRGSTIYKMKRGENDRISDKEKATIFDALMKELKSKAEDDINTQFSIEFLEKHFSGILNQNDRRKDSINQIKEGINNKITRAINAVTGLDDKAGLMVYHNGYSDNENLEENDYEVSLKKAKEEIKEKNDKYLDMVEYESDFNYDDQIELVKCLNKMIHNAVDEWTKIVDLAKEIRKEDMLEQCMQDIEDSVFKDKEMSMEAVYEEMNQINDNLLSSEKLVELASSEYEENNRNRK